MIHRLPDRTWSLRHHRRLDFLLDRDPELGVLPHVISSTVDTVSDGMLFRGVQREADIVLGITTALVGRSRTVALQCHDSHASLVAGGIAAVAVKHP